MADPVTPNGAITVALDVGKTMVVTAGANSSGLIAVFTGATVDLKEAIASNGTKTYGPYDVAKTVRLLPQNGTLNYAITGAVSSLPALIQAVVSDDGKTVTGRGVKPSSSVLVYLADTGVTLGTVNSLADGTWLLTNLRVALKSTDRVGYDAVIVGPVTTVGTIVAVPGQVTGLTLGATTSTSQALTWQAPVDGGDVADYLVEYRKTTDTSYSSVVSADLTEVLGGLTPATPYQFRVTARNASGTGLASAVVSKSTSAAPTTSTPGQISTDLSDPNSISPRV